MRLDFQGVFGDAWRWWKRDRDVLTGVAGPLIFAPQLAALLFVPAQPRWPENLGDKVAVNQWIDASVQWSTTYGLGVFFCDALAVYGALVLSVCYLGPVRPDVGGALRRALGLYPRFFVSAMLVQFAFGLGLVLFYLPGLYVAGRTSLVGPIFAAERTEGVLAPIRASFARTRGFGLILTAFAGVTILGSGVAGAIFQTAGESLGRAPLANPVSAVLIKVAIALTLSLGAVATCLVRVSLYRRIGSPEG